jgi:hypothetical protein
MSSTISMWSFIEPIQSDRKGGEVGTTSATGLPSRVMRIGFLVFWTWWNRAKPRALNSEIATSFMIEMMILSDVQYKRSNRQFRLDRVKLTPPQVMANRNLPASHPPSYT